MKQINDTWNGEERRKGDRRECIMHSKHEVLIESFQRRLKNLDDKDLVPMSTLKWWIGSVIGIFVTLFSISLYTSQSAISALNDIRTTQQVTISQIKEVKEDLKDIKEFHKEEMSAIRKEVDKLKTPYGRTY